LLYNTVYIFLLCRLRINHMKESCHLRLFSGLITWSKTVMASCNGKTSVEICSVTA
jgi:hypothetical protein